MANSEYVVVHMTREQARVIIDACENRAETMRDLLVRWEGSNSEHVQTWTGIAEALEEAASLVNNELISAGVRNENLSWGDVARQSAAGMCPASPDGTGPHVITDGPACDECGASPE